MSSLWLKTFFSFQHSVSILTTVLAFFLQHLLKIRMIPSSVEHKQTKHNNKFIKGKWNNCFSKFSNRVLPPIFISTILQSVRKENLAHYFPYDVKLGLLAHSRSLLANQKARNAIVGAENLLNICSLSTRSTKQ